MLTEVAQLDRRKWHNGGGSRDSTRASSHMVVGARGRHEGVHLVRQARKFCWRLSRASSRDDSDSTERRRCCGASGCRHIVCLNVLLCEKEGEVERERVMTYRMEGSTGSRGYRRRHNCSSEQSDIGGEHTSKQPSGIGWCESYGIDKRGLRDFIERGSGARPVLWIRRHRGAGGVPGFALVGGHA